MNPRTGRLARTLVALASVALAVLSLAGCGGANVPEPDVAKVSRETTAVSVFYPTGKILVEERRVLPVQENMPLVTLRELFKAEPQEHKILVVLPAARVRSLALDRKTGIATVDFTREILEFPEPDRKAKLVAFAAIVETLKQFDEIKGVRILVEGKSSGTVGGRDVRRFWGDISLGDRPVPIERETGQESTKTAR